MLTECLFVNVHDSPRFSNKTFMDQMVIAHCTGIARALGLKAKPKPPPPAPQTLWVVQVGAFGVKANAEKLAKELKDKGYDTLIKEQTK
jgi:N-acetylmuramoyl-L-alanine amidase